MDFIDKNLRIILDCINNNTYQEVETERFELKNFAGGWGDDWYKSVCAFLNTNGGIVVIGIDDKNKSKPAHYKFTGYTNSNANEDHLKQELPKKFTNKEGTPLNLSRYISHFEIRDFLNGKVAVVYVEELADDEKYVYYNGIAYQRKLTGDHAISKANIEEYEELKKDIIKHQELAIVKGVTLDLLNIDTLNQYILRFNTGKKRGEKLKTSLDDARSFLVRENFIRDNQPTILGMLVCGDYVENHIQGKCEADCYVILPNARKVAQSKEIINDNIIDLIERSVSFIWRNIQVGVLFTNGGTADPEYPEELIRESINNAFAHRNYNTDRFVIIEIRPNESLMIRNPGMFERRQRIHLDTEFGKIRRIIPIQVARNPKLTHLLKSFNYWEGKGRGLTSLVDACLDNLIDVPYYILMDGEIKLFIPKGKVYDDVMTFWLNSFAGYILKKYGRELTDNERIMLSFFYKSETLNGLERYTILITTDNNHIEVIAHLDTKVLIFKDPLSSDIYPIYRVDRTLIRKDFIEELIANDAFKFDDKDVLNAIYLHNQFALNTDIVSANSIATFMYLNAHKNITDVKDYDNFKRKIRSVFNKLETKGFIIRKDGKTKETGGKPNFMINKAVFLQ